VLASGLQIAPCHGRRTLHPKSASHRLRRASWCAVALMARGVCKRLNRARCAAPMNDWLLRADVTAMRNAWPARLTRLSGLPLSFLSPLIRVPGASVNQEQKCSHEGKRDKSGRFPRRWLMRFQCRWLGWQSSQRKEESNTPRSIPSRLHADNSPGHAARRLQAHQCLFGLTPSTTVDIHQTLTMFLARQRGESQRGMLLGLTSRAPRGLQVQAAGPLSQFGTRCMVERTVRDCLLGTVLPTVGKNSGPTRPSCLFRPTRRDRASADVPAHTANYVGFQHGDSKVVEICYDFVVRTTFSTSDEYRKRIWDMTQWEKLLAMLDPGTESIRCSHPSDSSSQVVG
jgi:hypothetical protein